MSQPLYRTVQGFIYGGPYDDVVNGKKIRKYMISMPGELEDKRVRVTVWDTHESVELNIGDWIVANGRWENYETQKKDSGEFVTNYQLSANKLLKLGSGLGDDSVKTEQYVSSPTTNNRREVNTGIDF